MACRCEHVHAPRGEERRVVCSLPNSNSLGFRSLVVAVVLAVLGPPLAVSLCRALERRPEQRTLIYRIVHPPLRHGSTTPAQPSLY